MIPSLDITYRSRHGAVQESLHVFIDAGLKYKWLSENEWTDDPEKVMQVFELGFGTGLNALLTAKEALSFKRKISYITIEPEPLEPEMAILLNYKDEAGYLKKMHQAEWNTPVEIHSWFKFTKFKTTLADFNLHDNAVGFPTAGAIFDLVYFDAFGPLTQPELWSGQSFAKVASMMKTGAILTTYCSKSVVRKTMMAAGFTVKKIQGPYGKREMVRAMK
ncbi:MAG: SAM-dependent methyltransferase [Chitinophagaceae bacterium]|nr:MAG: SAM-dependent methyltransferase [Chitinophagaceae bacterium]